MKRSEGRILTTHAGSLPRPPELVNLFARRVREEPVNLEEMERQILAAKRRVIPRQIAAGIDIPSDGEQSRETFFLYVRRRMSGFSGGVTRPPPGDVVRYPAFLETRRRAGAGQPAVSSFEVPKVTGAVRYLDPAAIERECTDLRGILSSAGSPVPEAFITAPSPGIIAAAVPNEHYDSQEAYLDALADALRVEYETIVAQGFVLQLDCPDLALERHVTYAGRPLREFLAFAERVVAAINRALRNVPRDSVRMHVCWGNYEGPHDLDVPLADILPTILQANVGGIVLPFANPRHAHEVRHLGAGALGDRVLVAGVIDTTTNYVEHPELVAQRIEQIAGVAGDPTRILAGTDCGFDSSAGMGRVAEDIVWAKLASLVEGARLASARLFRAG
jgi:5-methyltetrahydropteroyltriglutamate--homocysteine methyltransferase